MNLQVSGKGKPVLMGGHGLGARRSEAGLVEVAHACEGELELFKFGGKPVVPSAMAAEMRLKQARRIHLGAAFIAARRMEFFVIDHDRF